MSPVAFFFKDRPFKSPGYRFFSIALRRFANLFFLPLCYVDFFIAKLFRSPPDNLKSEKSIQARNVLIYSVFVNNLSELLRLKIEILSLQTEFDFIMIVNTGATSVLGISKNLEKIAVFDRENTQRDFGSYKFALKHLDFENCVQICLINDSVFWQKHSLTEFIKEAEQNEARIVGMTKSNQRGVHLQSYCILFKEPSIEDFRAILQLPPVMFKRSIVYFGEFRLSKELKKRQVLFDAIWDAEALLESFQPLSEIETDYREYLTKYSGQGISLNPSIHLAIPLYRKAGIIKKVILRENPAKFSSPIRGILSMAVQSILLDLPVKNLERD